MSIEKVNVSDFVKVDFDSVINGQSVMAKRDLVKGEIVGRVDIKEDLVDTPTRFTLQAAQNLHIKGESLKELVNLNHSCDPSLSLVYREHSLDFELSRNVKEGDSVTFSYNTTEYDMASPFECKCNSPNCYLTIK
eukprot:Awhi_evm1s3221